MNLRRFLGQTEPSMDGCTLYILPDDRWVVQTGSLELTQAGRARLTQAVRVAYERHKEGLPIVFDGYVRVVHT